MRGMTERTPQTIEETFRYAYAFPKVNGEFAGGEFTELTVEISPRPEGQGAQIDNQSGFDPYAHQPTAWGGDYGSYFRAMERGIRCGLAQAGQPDATVTLTRVRFLDVDLTERACWIAGRCSVLQALGRMPDGDIEETLAKMRDAFDAGALSDN